MVNSLHPWQTSVGEGESRGSGGRCTEERKDRRSFSERERRLPLGSI